MNRKGKRSPSPPKNDPTKKRNLEGKENVDLTQTKNGEQQQQHQQQQQHRPALIPLIKIQQRLEVTTLPLRTLRCEEASLTDYNEIVAEHERNEYQPPNSPSPADAIWGGYNELPSELQEHLLYFFQNERRFLPSSSNYFNDIQQELTPKMRGVLLSWLLEVIIDMKLSADTIYLCKNYIDRYLSLYPVPRSYLQLLGITCLFLASKLEDITPPTVQDLILVSDEIYEKRQIIELETKILKALKFSLASVHEKNFLRRYHLIELPFVRSKETAELVRFLSNYLLELCLLDYSLGNYLPSIIAAAVFSISLSTFGFAPWSPRLQQYTPYSIDMPEFQTVTNKITAIYQFTPEDSSIYLKYNTEKYHFIASYKTRQASMLMHIIFDCK